MPETGSSGAVMAANDSVTRGLRWMEVPKNGSIYSPRFAHSSTLLGGKVYVFGGDTGYFYTHVKLLNDLYVYDIETKQWSILEPQANGPVPEPRCGHTVLAYDNYLILFGGGGPKSQALNDIWLYRPEENLWQLVNPTGTLPPPRLFHTSVIHDDGMEVFGGLDGDNDIWRLDLKTFDWKKRPINKDLDLIDSNRPSPRWMHTAAVHEDKMYVFGGETSGGKATSELWVFDFLCGKWSIKDSPTVTGSPPGSRAFHAAVVLKNKWIIHAGRNDQAGKLGDAYEYHFAREEWRRVTTKLAPWCQSARWGHKIVFVPSKKSFIVTGGVTIEVLVLL